MAEQDQSKINPNIYETLGFAEQLISGNLVLAGSIRHRLFDLVYPTFSEQETNSALDWIKGKLGTELEDTPVKDVLRSSDRKISLTIYDVPLGPQDTPYYIAKVQHEGKKAMFIFGQEDAYKYFSELGYKPLDVV